MSTVNHSNLPWMQRCAPAPLPVDEWLTAAEGFIAEHPVDASSLNLLTLIAALYLRGLASAPVPDMTLAAEAESFALPENFAEFLYTQGLEEE
jgi:hypothetical protein